MSWKATAWVKSLRTYRDGTTLLQAREKLLLFVLADYHNEEQGFAWARENQIAEDALTSVRQVRRLLYQLESKSGLLRIDRRRPTGRCGQGSNHYHLLIGEDMVSVPVRTNRARGEDKSRIFATRIYKEPPLEPQKSKPVRAYARATPSLVLSDEHRRRIKARDDRLGREGAVCRELHVGTGPEVKLLSSESIPEEPGHLITRSEPNESSRSTNSETWKKILEVVKSQLNPHSYETWFQNLKLESCENGRLVIYVRDDSFKRNLMKHHGDLLRMACSSFSVLPELITYQQSQAAANARVRVAVAG